ncbi:unnamed protein product [Lathyrus oleraceus]|nr:protein ENHANCED PSEUDOMONAS SUSCEPTIBILITY 1-like [Pisum sativum]
MSSVQILSTTTIHAPNHFNDHTIHLTPWDLQFLPFGYNQTGLLYHQPFELDSTNQIQHFKNSLSSTLDFFHLFTGRLKITQHDDNTISCSIKCNNEGALLVHAAAKHISVSDILEPKYIPPIHHSLFSLNGVKNYEGTSQPLLAVQVTELVDGVFVGFTLNHVVGDGKSFCHFSNSLAEISKGCVKISKLPIYERWFPKDTPCPIRFPFTIEPQNNYSNNGGRKLNLPERLFHLTKENIAKLKFKANLEAGTTKLSSLQALLTHIWRSFIRSRKLDPQTEVSFVLDIGVRPRLIPPLHDDYFGTAVIDFAVTMKAGELLEDGGLGKGALKMNKMIALHSNEKLKSDYKNWLITPNFIKNSDDAVNNNSLVIGSSPWFDVYVNDFGWGKPVGVRSGSSNKRNGKVYVYAGVEKGSMDLEICLPYENLEAIGNDPEFMNHASHYRGF